MHLQTFKKLLAKCFPNILFALAASAASSSGNSHATPTQINNNKGDITEFNCERFAKMRRTKANKFFGSPRLGRDYVKCVCDLNSLHAKSVAICLSVCVGARLHLYMCVCVYIFYCMTNNSAGNLHLECVCSICLSACLKPILSRCLSPCLNLFISPKLSQCLSQSETQSEPLPLPQPQRQTEPLYLPQPLSALALVSASASASA